jgi:lysine 6-dehydrogenase
MRSPFAPNILSRCIVTKALVLGAGKQGYGIAWDLLRAPDTDEVVLADASGSRLDEVAGKLANEKLRTVQADARDRESLLRVMKSADIVANALVWDLNYGVTEAAVEAGISVVDLGSPSSINRLDQVAKSAGITIIPHCGLDPGIDRVLISYGASKLDTVEEVTVRCGGFPQKNVLPCPLDYKITWSIEGVIASYVEWDDLFEVPTGKPHVTIVKDGKKVSVEKLSGLERLSFPEPVGECEGVYTHAPLDVIANLGLKNVKECYSKTVRWPGHFEKFKTLIEVGLTSIEPHMIDGVEISPRKFLASHLSRILQYQRGEGDLVVMHVQVNGYRSGRRKEQTYEMIDSYDERNGLTAMSRTTGFPCSIVAQMVARDEITKVGVVPPEMCVPHEKFFTELAKRGIRITSSSKENIAPT